jgi:hypothetical protein
MMVTRPAVHLLLNRVLAAWLLCLALSASVFAKDQPANVMVWPETGRQVLRFTFGNLKQISSVGKEYGYISETTVENLWNQKIPFATFVLYLYDGNKVRIGDGSISLTNVEPGQTIKLQTAVHSTGIPVTMSLVLVSPPKEFLLMLPLKEVTITINSVPQGATLQVDGVEVGTTPKIVYLKVGPHKLEFSKAGFSTGLYSFDVGEDETSGGSINYELGTTAHDTIELRDGSVIVGDVESISGMDVMVRVGGAVQKFNRNQIKRILLVERE